MSAGFASLGSVAEFINGAAFKPDDWGDEGKPIVRIQNLTDPTKPFNRTKRHVAENLHVLPGDLLVSWSATLGVFEWRGPEVALLNQHIFRVLPDQARIDKRYLRYGLELALLDMQRHLHGATMQHVNRGEFLATKLYLPPLPEQRRIAEILDKADALRAKRRAALAQLDTLTQSIFLDMFGDPATNPKGWPTRRLDAVCSLVNGRAFKPEEWEEDGLPIIRIQNLNDATKPFNYTTQSLPERFRVHPGDILFSWSGTPGTSFGCFRWRGAEGWLNQHIFNVRLNGALEGDYFIAHVNLKLAELIAKAHGGVGLQHVTKGMVDETMLMVPPTHLQVEFARRVAGVEKLAADQQASLDGLDTLFAALQHRAFGGTLVRDQADEVAV
jgi:type I restriction enzyme S subunit